MRADTSTLASPLDGAALFVRSWQPDGDVKAVVQLAHGMAEHSARYERFAQALTDAVRERGIEPLLTAGRSDREFFDKLRAIPRGERVTEVLASAMTTWLTESDRDGPRPVVALSGDARTFTIGGMIALVSTWQMADAPPSTAQQVATLRTFAAAAAGARTD